jgi:hypothetical protein
MNTRPKAKSTFRDDEVRDAILNGLNKDPDSLNCIGEEARVDSAKTEESKYWFPSHARKRSKENAETLQPAALL